MDFAMLKSKFLLLVLLSLLYSMPSFSQSDEAKNEVVTALADLKDHLDNFLYLKERLDAVLEAYENGEEVELPFPESNYYDDKTVKETLVQVRDYLRGLKVPKAEDYGFPAFPELSSLSSTDLEHKHMALTEAVEYVRHYEAYFVHLEALDEELALINDRAATVRKAMREMARVLAELWQLAAGTPFGNMLGFEWFELEEGALPNAVSDIVTLSSKHQKNVKSLLLKSKTELSNLSGNLMNFLAHEAELLQKREVELIKMKNELGSVIDSFPNQMVEHLAESSKLEKIQNEIQSKREAYAKRAASLEVEIQAYNKALETYEVKRKAYNNYRYTLCPNKNSFEKCDHNELKNQYIEKKNKKAKEINSLGDKLENENKSIDQKNDALETEGAILLKQFEEFNSRVLKWKSKEEELHGIRQEVEGISQGLELVSERMFVNREYANYLKGIQAKH